MSLNDLRRLTYRLRNTSPDSPAYPSLAEVVTALLDAERGWSHDNDEIGYLVDELQALRSRYHGAVTALCREYEAAGRYAEMERADPGLGQRWSAYQDGLRIARDTLTDHPDGLRPVHLTAADAPEAVAR